jgi:Fe-S cluster biogenesis protein NfuA
MDLLSLFKKEPQSPSELSPLFAPVKDAMREVQAYARSHGGDIQLVRVSDEGEVEVKLRGTCAGCPMSTITLKHGVEERLMQLVPGVTRVLVA